MAQTTMPLKILWAKRASQDDSFQPATLVVACEGFSAMKLSHESSEIMQRVNAFFGYHAIDRLKIEQKSVQVKLPIPVKKMIVDEQDIQYIAKITDNIDDDGLRKSLQELGKSIFAEKNIQHDKKFRK